MKIIAISGSPRDKNTNYMLKKILEATDQEYELIRLKDLNIQPCKDCRKCHKTHKCVISDNMQDLYKKLTIANIIVLGSPTYFNNVTGIMKNFIDRCLPFWFSRKLEGKKAALVTVGNFEEYLEFDKKGKCKWHKEEIQSVKSCLKALEVFCDHLGINVIGSVYAVHSAPELKKQALVRLGRKLKKSRRR